MEKDTLDKHFQVYSCIPIPRFRSELNESHVRYIKTKEKETQTHCTLVFWQRNHLGESFLYGKFCRNHKNTIITIAYYHPNIGWITTH